MNQFKKISKLVFCTGLCSMALLFAAPACAIQTSAAVPTDTGTVSPQADVWEYVYRKMDDGIYKRLYNSSRNIWAGDWIYVGPLPD